MASQTPDTFAATLSINSGVANAHAESRQLIEDLLGGTKAMRARKTIYLPSEEGETVKSYETRVSRTFLNNYFQHTVSKLSSEVFSKEVVFEEPKNDKEKTAERRFSLCWQNACFLGTPSQTLQGGMIPP